MISLSDPMDLSVILFIGFAVLFGVLGLLFVTSEDGSASIIVGFAIALVLTLCAGGMMVYNYYHNVSKFSQAYPRVPTGDIREQIGKARTGRYPVKGADFKTGTTVRYVVVVQDRKVKVFRGKTSAQQKLELVAPEK